MKDVRDSFTSSMDDEKLNALLDEEAESLEKEKKTARKSRASRLEETKKARAYSHGCKGKTGVHIKACDRNKMISQDPAQYVEMVAQGKLSSPLEVNRKRRIRRLYDGDEEKYPLKDCSNRRSKRKADMFAKRYDLAEAIEEVED